ncbi:uncharacterized protein LOC125045949 [Penaeus chinensis]|uniref:uncharacterized protein LOC125045949 n=1 Tax=Penaeus chinensis TaxID=139456 RepID=UPI001FB68BB2|nr:uncharacterized protein LOC125045949 [Penaeus chinensis]
MPDCSLTKRPATIMCDATSPEMVNALPVKEESEVSLTEDCSMGLRERRNGDTLLQTKKEEDITIKEECSYDEEHLVIVDPLLTFHCKQCKNVFATQCDLDVHMEEKHVEGEHLSCKKCSETFLKECELMLHAKLHSPEKPFTDKECHSQDELSAKTSRISSSPPRPKYRRILPRIAPPLETQDSESSFGENDHSDSEEENSTGYLDPSQSYPPEPGETNPKQKDGNGTAATASMKDLSSVSSTVGHPVWCTNTCDTRERPTIGSMKMDCQEEKPERSIPLTESQQECLVALIREKKDVVLCKSQEPKLLSIKKRVWKEITENFNSLNPGQKPRNTAQLKRALDHIKRRVKEEQSKYRRRVLANGVGPPPDPPKFTEAMMAAMEIMGQELSMNDIPFV